MDIGLRVIFMKVDASKEIMEITFRIVFITLPCSVVLKVRVPGLPLLVPSPTTHRSPASVFPAPVHVGTNTR